MPATKKPLQGDSNDAVLRVQVLEAEIRDLQAVLQQMTQELDAAKTEGAKYRDIAAQSPADLQNAKARMDRDREDIGKFALESTMQQLLPAVDHFQRAFQHLPADLKNHEWVKGIAAIEQSLLRTLESIGLKRMQSLGEVADPNRHEILQTGKGPAGVILEVFEEGYELHGKVLRPAKVKAGDGTSEATG